MPAAIGAGGPVAVCHGGLAGEFFRRLEASRAEEVDASAAAAGHEAHAMHGGLANLVTQPGQSEPGAPGGLSPAADHESWEHCPFGAAFGSAAIAGDVALALPTFTQDFEVVEPALAVPYRPVSSYRARAPPSPAIPS
jgi:hypothetical protein